jgi:Phage capsid scaffolding protein (GPO) serine peptidase
MAGKKSKKFVIATEGATVDGRTIDRAWIEQMAGNYNPSTYKAGINIEHIRSVLPDSPFKNYGFVDALSTQQTADGKLQLMAEITPSDDLVKLVKSYQKTFTSIEVSPKFAGTEKAYLVGLAVTDAPASLGTDMLEFTAQKPEGSPLTKRKQNADNHFSVATETSIEFIDAEDKPGILERITAMFASKGKADDSRFSDIERAIEEVAEHGQTQSTQTAQTLEQVEQTVNASSQRTDAIDARVKALEDLFNTTEAPRTPRPSADGGNEQLTQF